MKTPARELISIHRDTLSELFSALEFLSEDKILYERNPVITITGDVFPKDGFTAVIVVDVEEEDEDERT